MAPWLSMKRRWTKSTSKTIKREIRTIYKEWCQVFTIYSLLAHNLYYVLLSSKNRHLRLLHRAKPQQQRCLRPRLRWNRTWTHRKGVSCWEILQNKCCLTTSRTIKTKVLFTTSAPQPKPTVCPLQAILPPQLVSTTRLRTQSMGWPKTRTSPKNDSKPRKTADSCLWRANRWPSLEASSFNNKRNNEYLF